MVCFLVVARWLKRQRATIDSLRETSLGAASIICVNVPVINDYPMNFGVRPSDVRWIRVS